MNCCYCDRPLICDGCQAPFRVAAATDFQRLHQPECPVLCPNCKQVLRCRHCGAVYSGADDEYEHEAE